MPDRVPAGHRSAASSEKRKVIRCGESGYNFRALAVGFPEQFPAVSCPGVQEGCLAFERITTDPAIMGGLPCIRGMRIPVATVVGMLADGMSVEDIVVDLPDLIAEDVTEALRYAAEAVRERELPLHGV